jgi:nucleotide-binding universal stress UspA family protein
MKILLAVDGSEYTVRAVTYLSSHLDWFRGEPELHLLHVRQPIPAGLAVEQARRILGEEGAIDYYKEESAAALAPAEKILRSEGIPFHSHYKVGDITKEIHAFALKKRIDLIAMGSHGHGALANVVLGSIATKVLAASTVPVLIVR